MKERQTRAFFMKDNPRDKDLCPICNFKLGSCHIGEFCTNDNCEGNYVDGVATLNSDQIIKFKDLIAFPWRN